MIKRFKYILVAKGFDQRLGIDFQFTFYPAVKPTIVWLVLTLALHFGWLISQLNINNAFFQGHLKDDVYMAQLPWFLNDDYPIHVYKLYKAIYGLRQAPCAWFIGLRSFLLAQGFQNSKSDTSLFSLWRWLHHHRDLFATSQYIY